MNTAEIATIRQRVIALHRIQRQLEEVFEVVTPNPAHTEVYGEATGQILTLAAAEVEQLLKEVFVACHRERHGTFVPSTGARDDDTLTP